MIHTCTFSITIFCLLKNLRIKTVFLHSIDPVHCKVIVPAYEANAAEG